MPPGQWPGNTEDQKWPNVHFSRCLTSGKVSKTNTYWLKRPLYLKNIKLKGILQDMSDAEFEVLICLKIMWGICQWLHGMAFFLHQFLGFFILWATSNYTTIPNISHQYHQYVYVSVEKKSVTWRNFRFLYMKNVEISGIFPDMACIWCGEWLHMYNVNWSCRNLCGEKFKNKCAVEKNYKSQVCITIFIDHCPICISFCRMGKSRRLVWPNQKILMTSVDLRWLIMTCWCL